MAFIFLKTALSLLLPPASPVLLMALGFLVGLRRVLGRLLVAAGFFLLYFLSISPVSLALLKPLETGFVPWNDGAAVKADAIVVLGGGVRDLTWLDLPSEPSCSSNQRVVKGLTIYRRHHLPLVFMGGNGDPSRTMTPDAEAMARTALELGVPARDVKVENKSRNTLEGAQALKGMIRGHNIILVTSAFHLKRASAMFAKQGFHVMPVPAGYRYERKKLTFFSFLPRAGNLDDSSTALSEYAGLLWYSLNKAI